MQNQHDETVSILFFYQAQFSMLFSIGKLIGDSIIE